MAPTFGNEAPARSQRAEHGCDHRVGALDPVQHCIAKDGIELISERQRFTVHHVRVQPKLLRRLDLRSARINGDDLTPQIDQLFRKHTVSTTQVENALAGLWRQ
jgi:hypothetical protein